MTELPDETQISDLEDSEADMAERLDGAHYRDDILRLLFICCHPDLPRRSKSRSRFALYPACRSPRSRARFLVGEAAMSSGITRAKRRRHREHRFRDTGES